MCIRDSPPTFQRHKLEVSHAAALRPSAEDEEWWRRKTIKDEGRRGVDLESAEGAEESSKEKEGRGRGEEERIHIQFREVSERDAEAAPTNRRPLQAPQQRLAEGKFNVRLPPLSPSLPPHLRGHHCIERRTAQDYRPPSHEQRRLAASLQGSKISRERCEVEGEEEEEKERLIHGWGGRRWRDSEQGRCSMAGEDGGGRDLSCKDAPRVSCRCGSILRHS
eukprot:180664-Hanusia_phi.AAC.1